MSRRNKIVYPTYEPGDSVTLTRPILLYGCAALGLEYDPPHEMFPIGEPAVVLRENGKDYYQLSLADGYFIITRHVTSITKADGDHGNG